MDRTEQDRVRIFDTTLRDGEQSPGISLNKSEKLEIAHQLARLGVDIIEAGFPISSPGDFEAVQAIAREVHGPVICGLARANAQDVDAAWNAIRDSSDPIHTFISTSDIHIEHQLQTTREDVKGQARAAVAQARGYCDDVEFSPMDATRSDLEFTAEVLQIALDEGATTINVPDTVGYSMPDEHAEMWRTLYRLVPGLAEVVTSVHCHDDLGLAVANSFAGLRVGCRQVECAVNGIGERAGNASLEEIVMLIRVREAAHGLWTGVDTTEIARTSRMVSRITGYQVQPNKAIVGRNAFAHESGIHQDGVLKERTTYEIMDATTIGLETNALVLGKRSGPARAAQRARRARLPGRRAALNTAFKRFKELADKKKKVTALDLEAIVADEMKQAPAAFELESFDIEASSTRSPLARVRVRRPDGEVETGSFTGDGPVDAFFSALNAATHHEARLKEYHVSAVTGGRDALGEVTVLLELDGRLSSGAGVSTDILEASGKAYLRALSNALDNAVSEAERCSSRKPRRRPPDRTGLHLARRRAADPLWARRAGGSARSALGQRFRRVHPADHRARTGRGAGTPRTCGAGASRAPRPRRRAIGRSARSGDRATRRGPGRRPRDRHGEGDRGCDRAVGRGAAHHAVRRRANALPPHAQGGARSAPRAALAGCGRPGGDGLAADAGAGRERDERPGPRHGVALHAVRQPGGRAVRAARRRADRRGAAQRVSQSGRGGARGTSHGVRLGEHRHRRAPRRVPDPGSHRRQPSRRDQRGDAAAHAALMADRAPTRSGGTRPGSRCPTHSRRPRASPRLSSRCGYTRLSELGVAHDDLPGVAAAVLRHPALRNTPEPPDEADLLGLLRSAY